MSGETLKVASFAIPMIGGIYSAVSRVRRELGQRGIELRWIGVGERGEQAWNEPGMEAERMFGDLAARTATDDRERADQVIEHLLRERFDGVLIDVLGGAFQANIARYLPSRIFRVLVVHSITPGTYAYARTVRDHAHFTIGVSPRIRSDLVAAHGFPADRTICIPNGVEVDRYDRCPRAATSPTLRVLLLGRIDDAAKGVLLLPKIATLVKDRDVSFTVVGDGPDLPALKSACAPMRDRITLRGPAHPDDVPAILAMHDVLLFPSRFEGLPLALVEAMASGCVPIASRIHGVTDYVVDDGRTGLLFPVGSVGAAATALRRVQDDRAFLNAMARAAFVAARQRFDMGTVGRSYSDVLQVARHSRGVIKEPLPTAEWTYPRGLKSTWRSSLPAPLKNVLRVALERSRSWFPTQREH